MSTKSPKSDKQYVWEGEAESSSYTIREETDPEKLLPRGTRLTLYLKVYLLILISSNSFYTLPVSNYNSRYCFSVRTRVSHTLRRFRNL